MQNIKFDWNDISIIPAPISQIRSRSEINTFYNKKLPLIISPMDTVIDEENINTFLQLGYEVCVPRGVNNKYDDAFTSYGIEELQDIINHNKNLPKKVLLDVANGHSIRVLELTQSIKTSYPDTLLMVGNIANPETYKEYCKIGVDYVRVGIGGGCFTPDSEVCTKNGLTSLQNIKEGDFVLTHKGVYREVLQKHYFHKTEQMIRVNDLPLCTKNHEFLVIKIDDFDNFKPITKENYLEYATWISADKLNTQDHMLININNFDLNINELNFEFVPIDSIYFEFYNGEVIDLSIQEDESYNIEGVIVHNSACTSSANASIHFPMGSLIAECAKIKEENCYETKIVADGGFKSFRDIITALGVGADYIMLGGIPNKSLEACGKTYIHKDNKYVEIYKYDAFDYFNKGETVYRQYRGMSTKDVQKSWGKKKLTTSEGISFFNKVEYSMVSWTENFVDYLKSAMSYCNKKNITDFVGGIQYVHITSNAFNRFNK